MNRQSYHAPSRLIVSTEKIIHLVLVMSEVKIFRVKGVLVKPRQKTPFVKELRSTTSEAALEKVYTDFGSQHRAKRFQVIVKSIEEIEAKDASNPVVRQMSGV